MVDTIKLEEPKTELINILRWEEDGGTILEINDSMPNWQFAQPVPINSINRTMRGVSLPWNPQFGIETFHAVTRIDLIKKKAPTNRPSV